MSGANAMAKQPNAAPCPSGGSYLRLTPAQHGTDGFFVAVLERNAAAKPAPKPSDASPEATMPPPEATMIDSIRIRRARAGAMPAASPRVHVESWRSAYAGILPDQRDRADVRRSEGRVLAPRSRPPPTASGLLVAELRRGRHRRLRQLRPAPPRRSPGYRRRDLSCSMSCPTGRSRASAAACSAAACSSWPRTAAARPWSGCWRTIPRASSTRRWSGKRVGEKRRGDLGRHRASDRLWLAQTCRRCRRPAGGCRR